MKTSPFRAPESVLEAAAQGRRIVRGAIRLAGDYLYAWLGALILAGLAGVLLFSHDNAMLERLHASAFAQEKSTLRAAAFLGTWGDYPTYNVPLALLIWIYGYATKSRAWRRTAVICFLGASLAGFFDDCFRLTLGRPRPDAHVPDGFYGLPRAFTSHYQSFPSGHAAAVFGTAVALLVVRPWFGLVATVFALLVVWARMELWRHYPTDVAVGTAIGICAGLLIGWGANVRLPRRAQVAPS